MARGARGARELLVGDIADENVSERVLRPPLASRSAGLATQAPSGRAYATCRSRPAGRGRPSHRARRPRTPCRPRLRRRALISYPGRACRGGPRSAPGPSPATAPPQPLEGPSSNRTGRGGRGPSTTARTPQQTAGCRRLDRRSAAATQSAARRVERPRNESRLLLATQATRGRSNPRDRRSWRANLRTRL